MLEDKHDNGFNKIPSEPYTPMLHDVEVPQLHDLLLPLVDVGELLDLLQ